MSDNVKLISRSAAAKDKEDMRKELEQIEQEYLKQKIHERCDT